MLAMLALLCFSTPAQASADYAQMQLPEGATDGAFGLYRDAGLLELWHADSVKAYSTEVSDWTNEPAGTNIVVRREVRDHYSNVSTRATPPRRTGGSTSSTTVVQGFTQAQVNALVAQAVAQARNETIDSMQAVFDAREISADNSEEAADPTGEGDNFIVHHLDNLWNNYRWLVLTGLIVLLVAILLLVGSMRGWDRPVRQKIQQWKEKRDLEKEAKKNGDDAVAEIREELGEEPPLWRRSLEKLRALFNGSEDDSQEEVDDDLPSDEALLAAQIEEGIAPGLPSTPPLPPLAPADLSEEEISARKEAAASAQEKRAKERSSKGSSSVTQVKPQLQEGVKEDTPLKAGLKKKYDFVEQDKVVLELPAFEQEVIVTLEGFRSTKAWLIISGGRNTYAYLVKGKVQLLPVQELDVIREGNVADRRLNDWGLTRMSPNTADKSDEIPGFLRKMMD